MVNKKNTVLVVDDDQTTCLVLKEVLQLNNFIVFTANDGKQAYEIMTKELIDLTLLDVLLPDTTGFDICRHIRQQPGGQYHPIIIITSSEDYNSINEAYEAGATDFISKPINIRQLPHKIKYLLKAKTEHENLISTSQLLSCAKKLGDLANWVWDLNKKQLEFSPEMFELLKIDKNANISNIKLLDFVHPDDKELIRQATQKLFQEFQAYELEYKIIDKQNNVAHVLEKVDIGYDNQNNPTFFSGTLQDISKRKRNEADLKFLTKNDPLTSLPNRYYFVEELENVIAVSKKLSLKFAIFLTDIDNFQSYNDNFGYAFGDKLLKAVGEKIQQFITSNSQHGFLKEIVKTKIARHTGDEFLIFVPYSSSNELTTLASNLLSYIHEPIFLEHKIALHISIGISTYPSDDIKIQDLIKKADMAMYQAKKLGKNTYKFYDNEVNEALVRRFVLKQALAEAVEKKNYYFVFQPQFNLANAQLCGLEMLIRWQHPEYGFISPEEFLPIAEESHLIHEITRQTVQIACETIQNLKKANLAVPIAINFSATQLYYKNLLEIIEKNINEYNISSGLLNIEITEKDLVSNYQLATTLLKSLESRGIYTHLDDFGTGFSSLEYLSILPLHALKIDKSFVMNFENDEKRQTITKAIISLAKALHLATIAEGVECESDRQILKDMGCEIAQGFYFSKPVPLEEILKKYFLK